MCCRKYDACGRFVWTWLCVAESAYDTAECITGEGSAGWLWNSGETYGVGICGDRVPGGGWSGTGEEGECGTVCVGSEIIIGKNNKL